MLAPRRRRTARVIEQLLAEPQRFGFFQAVRLLERWFVREQGLAPGETVTRKLRFRNSLSLNFPTSEIESLEVHPAELEGNVETNAIEDSARGPNSREVDRIEITPTFMGLLGNHGTLPTFYTELLAQRETYHRDRAARAFMDIFSDRALGLFYAAWKKHRLHLQYETDRHNRFLPLVLSIAGLGQSKLRDRLQANDGGVSDEAVAYYAGTVQQRPVSARQMQRLLAEYFQVPMRIEQFVGRWFNLPSQQRTRLGGANAVLGANAFASERIWQRALRMKLHIGPMKREQFRGFLPGGRAAAALREMLTLLTGVAFEYEVSLVLRQSEVRPTSIGRDPTRGRLGWDAWMITRPPRADVTDAGYEIHAVH